MAYLYDLYKYLMTRHQAITMMRRFIDQNPGYAREANGFVYPAGAMYSGRPYRVSSGAR